MQAKRAAGPGRILAACVLALLAAGVAAAGDAAAARALLEDGKKAVNARKFDEAATLLRKALEEDPDLAEAAYWIGAAREKTRDEAGALSAYREFLAILDRKGGGSAEEKKLRTQAEKRVEALALGEKELQKLEDKYLDDLLVFATARVGKDNGAAFMALDRILALRPGYPAAVSLRQKMEGRSDDVGANDPDGPPLREVKKWRDFLEERRFVTPLITYADRLMVIDTTGGSRNLPAKPIDSGKSFVWDMEFRTTKVHGADWLAGVTFGESGGVFLAAFATVERVVLIQGTSSGPRDIAHCLLPKIETGAWHRLVVAVRGNRARVWFDGKPAIDHEFADRKDLQGELGTYHQAARVEHRVLRVGDW